MKTVKDMSEITGVSIRTLRYYDEIGLLKPTELTEAGYRLYDNKALEKLKEIMFFRELEIPLSDIKKSRSRKKMPKYISSLCLQKQLAIWIWHILLLKCLQKIIKQRLRIDNARNILLDLAKEYLQGEKLVKNIS